jgi:hypothetical protein
MKSPTSAELEEYKALTRADLQDVRDQISKCPRLTGFLKTWPDAVEGHIEAMKSDLKISDAAYHLFRIFRDEQGLIQEIEDGLALIEPLARAAGKTDSSRETPQRLAIRSMDQINQIESAIFEIVILRGLIRAASSAGIKIELYPNVGTGKSNVEARLWIDGRWCYVEAKALGYTKNMPGAQGQRVGAMSIDSMTAPIAKALEEKTTGGKQLACVSPGEPAVVFLAQKGFLERQIANATARDFMASRPAPLSGVLMFGSALCRTAPDLVVSPAASCPLTDKEAGFFHEVHRHHGFNHADYLRVANRIVKVAKASVTTCGARPQTRLRERVTLYLIAKVVTTFESIVCLMELGHDCDAHILARSLLEAYAKAHYIKLSPDPDKAAKEFADHWIKKTAKAFKRAEGYPEPFFKDFLADVDPQKEMRARDTKTVYWVEKITEMFNKISADTTIGTFPREWYDILSDLVHSNASAMRLYLDPKAKFSPFLSRPGSRKDRSPLLHVLCAITMMAVELLCEAFDQPKPAESPELASAMHALPSAPTAP